MFSARKLAYLQKNNTSKLAATAVVTTQIERLRSIHRPNTKLAKIEINRMSACSRSPQA